MAVLRAYERARGMARAHDVIAARWRGYLYEKGLLHVPFTQHDPMARELFALMEQIDRVRNADDLVWRTWMYPPVEERDAGGGGPT